MPPQGYSDRLLQDGLLEFSTKQTTRDRREWQSLNFQSSDLKLFLRQRHRSKNPEISGTAEEIRVLLTHFQLASPNKAHNIAERSSTAYSCREASCILHDNYASLGKPPNRHQGRTNGRLIVLLAW